MAEYDIVVAGGGPAGLQFAREIARRTTFSIAVLERNAQLSDNDKSTGGTFHQVIDGFDIPSEVVMSSCPDVRFEGPDAQARLPIPNHVLDFPNFLEFLGRDAAEHGAEIHTGVTVEEPITDDGRVVGVECRDGGDTRTYRADLIVDATGPAGTLTQKLGMWDPTAAQRGIGKEYELTGEFDYESMLFRFDHRDAPGGYAWVFPAGDGVFKAGVCWVDEFYDRHSPPDDGTIDDYVEEWIERDSRWQAEDRRAVHAGQAILDNSINQRAADGIVAIGDAVSSINPLFGEGIRPGMESARMAADVAIDAVEADECSRERLRTYERRWNSQKGADWRLQRIVGELLYDFTPAQQTAFVENTADLSDEQARRLQQYDLTVGDLWALYPARTGDLRKLPRLWRHLR